MLLVNQLFALISKYESKKFGEAGITGPQFYVIAAIKYLPPPVSATDIAKWLKHSVNTVNITVRSLVRSGLVKRTRNIHDRRHLSLSLTPKCLEIYEKAIGNVRRMPEEMMSCLSREKLQILSEINRILIENLARQLDIDDPASVIDPHRVDVFNEVLKKEQIELVDLQQLLKKK
jgi:DNA-binding MarR family transcriptional regulator